MTVKLKQHIQGRSIFQFYRSGTLYYKTDTDFLFRVPVAEGDTADYNGIEKSITLMKFIREELEDLHAEQNA